MFLPCCWVKNQRAHGERARPSLHPSDERRSRRDVHAGHLVVALVLEARRAGVQERRVGLASGSRPSAMNRTGCAGSVMS